MLTTVEELEALYGAANPRSIAKEIHVLNEDYRAFVEASPFVVLSSVGEGRTDCSPKGDKPGFVRILDTRTLVIPDRPGNNRIDNLKNILHDPRVSVLFIIPGIAETLRVNGRACISVDEELLLASAVDGKKPKTVIVIKIDSVYFHCSKAIIRSDLWNPGLFVPKDRLPGAGQMLKRLSGAEFDLQTYERQSQQRILKSLY